MLLVGSGRFVLAGVFEGPASIVGEAVCDSSAPAVAAATGAAISSRSPLRFRAEARQVLVPVVVTDEHGRPARELGHGDFRLFEDGQEQTIDAIMHEETPLTLALIVDVSASMRSKMENTLNALEKLIDVLNPGDRVVVIGFHYGVVPVHELTCDPAAALHALERFEPSGGTAMFDGIVEGLYRLYKIGPATRRALILLSDGFDNASFNTPRETVAAAKATGVPIYAVGLGKQRRSFLRRLFTDQVDDEFNGVDEIRLRELAESTGGRAFLLSDVERRKSVSSEPVADAFASLAREVRGHYLLSYQPSTTELDGRWHELRVDVSTPGFLVRFRPGYLALPLE